MQDPKNPKKVKLTKGWGKKLSHIMPFSKQSTIEKKYNEYTASEKAKAKKKADDKNKYGY